MDTFPHTPTTPGLDDHRRARFLADRYWDEVRPRNQRNAHLDAIDREGDCLFALAWERMERHEDIADVQSILEFAVSATRATVVEFRTMFPLLASFVLDWPPPPGLNWYPPEIGMVRHVLDRLEMRASVLDRQLRLF